MGHYDSSYEHDEEEKRKRRKVWGYTVTLVGTHDYYGEFFAVEDDVFSGCFVVSRYGIIRELTERLQESVEEAIECAEVSVEMLKVLKQYLKDRKS